jgi:hypothetical protein
VEYASALRVFKVQSGTFFEHRLQDRVKLGLVAFSARYALWHAWKPKATPSEGPQILRP